jgi:low temperature requirement protein LtrA
LHAAGLSDRLRSLLPRRDRSETYTRFKRWFWRPPRPHGEVISDRSVSPLELLYDLVYVAVIGQATHHLAAHITLRGIAEFTVVFALIWIAWVNGSLYLELHGREDGRTRAYVFVQMGMLVLVAVFTADAAGDDGAGFAVAYAAFLAVVTWLWYTVRRQDQETHSEFMTVVGHYAWGMIGLCMLILASAALPNDARLLVWATVAAGWLLGMLLIVREGQGIAGGLSPTHSLVERFGLFTIVVLGELVLGAVAGFSLAGQDFKTIVTGMLALGLGFGFWWIYFDLVGGRMPSQDGAALGIWLTGHLPVAGSIAAAGAGIVSLIEHAHDSSTPAETAWLVAGSVAIGLVALTLIEGALTDTERLSSVYRPLRFATGLGAAAAIVVGFGAPPPWLLALLLVAILTAVWLFAVTRFLRADAWGEG